MAPAAWPQCPASLGPGCGTPIGAGLAPVTSPGDSDSDRGPPDHAGPGPKSPPQCTVLPLAPAAALSAG